MTRRPRRLRHALALMASSVVALGLLAPSATADVAASPGTGAAPFSVALTALPALPEGIRGPLQYDAPWVYVAMHARAATGGLAPDSPVWRTRDDGTTPWESVPDAATGRQAVTRDGLVVGGGEVAVQQQPAKGDPCGGGWRVVGTMTVLPTCGRPVLSPTGVVASQENGYLAMWDSTTGRSLRSWSEGVMAPDGRVWTATPGDVRAFDPRTGAEVARRPVPEGCRRTGFSLLGSSAAGLRIACLQAAVTVDVDGTRPPAVPTPYADAGLGFEVGSVFDGSPARRFAEFADLGSDGATQRVPADDWIIDRGTSSSVLLRTGGALSIARPSGTTPVLADTVAPTLTWTSTPPPVRGPSPTSTPTWAWAAVDGGRDRGFAVEAGWSDLDRGGSSVTPAHPLGIVPAVGSSPADQMHAAEDPCFFVRAIDVAGNTSPLLRTCSRLDEQVPTALWNLSEASRSGDPAVFLGGRHRIDWVGMDDVGVAYSELERRDAPTGRAFTPWSLLTRTTAQRVQRRVGALTTSCYRVRVVDHVGQSAYAFTTASLDSKSSPVVCVDPPRDDRSLTYRGPGRATRHRAPAGIADTVTSITGGKSIVLRESGVSTFRIGTHYADAQCPRVTVSGRTVPVRCSAYYDRWGRRVLGVDLRGVRSGRFVITPRGGMRVDYVTAVRRPPS